MANPTRRWDSVPVFGVWMRASDDSPEHGVIHLETTERIQTADGRIIYPAGARVSVTVGDQSAQDVSVRAAVRAAWRAADQALDGDGFDGEAWDTWWDTVILPAAIFTRFPAADDPDIATTGWQVKVTESLNSARGREYYVTPLLAHLDEPVPGVNLCSVAVPPGSPTAPAPVYMKGLAGGVAPLDSTGKVPAEHLPDDIAGGGGLDEAALEEWVGEHVVPTIPTAPGDIGAVPTTRTVAGKPLSADVTLAAADVGAVPTSRTVAGKALSSDITLGTSDIAGLTADLAAKADASALSGYVPTTRTIAGKPLSSNVSLTASDVSAVPTTRTVAGKALSSDVTLVASDVGAVPTSRTVNGKALSSNVTISAGDVAALPLATSRPVIYATGSGVWPTRSSVVPAGYTGPVEWDHSAYGPVSTLPSTIAEHDVVTDLAP